MRQLAIRNVCRLAVGVFVTALVIHMWFLMGLVTPVTVAGNSMLPTLDEARRLVIDRTAFEFRQPRRWEVVVLRSPDDASQLCVKRVVGLPDEEVELRQGEVWVNGQRVACPQNLSYEMRYRDRGHCWLGPHDFFVLGDNAAVSDDSRSWLTGPGVDRNLLVGKPLGVR